MRLTGGERRLTMADLTIKFKGQPIVEMTESGTKTLKTAGKYCEGDISVEYVKPAGGDHTYQVGNAVSILEVNMDMFETRAVEHIIKKYSYNSVVLPEIPADVLAQYPYAWIRLGSDGKTYDLILSSYSWYFTDKLLTQSSKYVWYTATIEAGWWVYKTTYTDTGEFDLAGGLIWSNHDIPNGSATATEIYFNGSEPVLAE